MLAQDHKDWEVTLIAPKNFEYDTDHSLIFGGHVRATGESIDKGNFKIIVVPVTNTKIGWYSTKMCEVIDTLKPDVLYHIGGHTQLSLVQCIKLVQRKMKNTKMVAFSMRGPAMNISRPRLTRLSEIKNWTLSYASYLLRKRNLRYFNNGCDAVICHYPDAIRCFREEGFSNPIYMSTQVGVDPDVYYPNDEYRTEIREKLNLGDSFVFGTAVRFLPMKGLQEIIEALPSSGDWKLLIMGKGDENFKQSLVRRITARGIQEKVIFTGYIEWDEIAKYWNAIDCSIHVPRTTEKWEETFSLSIVQAMASAKPVIGNTSGSVPYQLGPDGIIVQEGDIDSLSSKIEWVMTHRDEAKKIGEEMYNYAIRNFSIKHLNNQFYAIISDILSGKYSKNLIDMTSYNEQI